MTNLRVPQVIEGLLIGSVGFLQIVHHQMAMA